MNAAGPVLGISISARRSGKKFLLSNGLKTALKPAPFGAL
jgi:hypothetical protein